MKKTTINIQNEANINAEGKLNTKNCKPVVCLETGEVFTSVTDAAKAIGVLPSNLSKHLTGNSRKIHGKRFCYLTRSMESLDTIVTRLRETAAMEEDARKWREYQEEQERVRKANEEREVRIEKARDKVRKCDEICENLERKLKEANQRLIEAEKEFEDLIGPHAEEDVA